MRDRLPRAATNLVEALAGGRAQPQRPANCALVASGARSSQGALGDGTRLPVASETDVSVAEGNEALRDAGLIAELPIELERGGRIALRLFRG